MVQTLKKFKMKMFNIFLFLFLIEIIYVKSKLSKAMKTFHDDASAENYNTDKECHRINYMKLTVRE